MRSLAKEAKRIERLCLAGDWAAGEKLLKRILPRAPDPANVLQALGACHIQLGQPDRAIRAFRAALEIDPKLVDSRNDLIFLLDQHPDVTPEDMRREWQQWWARHGAPRHAKRESHTNIRDPERSLRVGYLSGDFRLHSAAIGFGPFVLAHSDQVTPYCYSTLPHDKFDPVTHEFQRRSLWRDVHKMSIDRLVEQIRTDGIDVLVDLAGNTNLNRLEAFCARPAPVQVTSWAHGTWMGMVPAFDAFWADPVMLPAEERAGFAGRIVDLPCIMAYEGPLWMPPVNALPCLERPITFGSFNRALKINEPVLKTWREILRRVPSSRLVFKDATFQADKQTWVRAVMGEQAAQCEFLPELEVQREHIGRYADIDLVLDTFPQTGGITSLEGLYMGVPPVTVPGERLNSRVSASFMAVLGLPDFVATSVDDYVDLAVAWVTTRRDELAGIRLGLRERLENSPLHGKNFTPAVEAMYRDLWRSWCASS